MVTREVIEIDIHFSSEPCFSIVRRKHRDRGDPSFRVGGAVLSPNCLAKKMYIDAALIDPAFIVEWPDGSHSSVNL
jgi:hypothetical protein